MAEIEHFMDPAEKSHPKFDSVRDVEVALYSGSNQMDGKGTVKTTIGKAVDEVRRRGFELRAAGVGSLNYRKFELREI
jgi:glycyl-tRNA synthetase (class II)